MKIIGNLFAAFILISSLFSSCSNPELPLVKEVNLESYMGKWFEIAALPGGIRKGCTCTSFEYKLSKNRDYIMVINSCIKKGKEGAILAKAFVDKNSAGSMWEMQFFWPFKKDYCIVALADDYSFAMAGDPDRKSLWILNRNPVMDTATYHLLVDIAQKAGYDTTKLIITSCDCNFQQ